MSGLLVKNEKQGEAILSLKVIRPDYDYPPFRQPLTRTEQCELDGILDRGMSLTVLSEDAFSRYVSSYVCSVIEDSALGGDIDKGCRRLASLRSLCKDKFPLISRRVDCWLFDLCLSQGQLETAYSLCGTPSHSAFLERDYRIGLAIADVLGSYKSNTDEHILGAVSAASSYNYAESRYYKGNEELFRSAISAAVYALLRRLREDDELPTSLWRTVRRYAYAGLPCRAECARVFEITYHPYSELCELMGLISSAALHTENLLRQGLGVKAKLPGVTLSAEYRRVCAEAVREELPGFLPTPAKVGRKPKKRDENAEKASEEKARAEQVEAIDLNVDFSRARQLEAESWQLASMLGGDYGVGDISLTIEDLSQSAPESLKKSEDVCGDNGNGTVKDSPEYAPKKAESIADECADVPEEWRELFGCLSRNELAFLRCIASGGDTDALARSLGDMATGVADRINEKASDSYGDIIIDTSGTALSFFEEYDNELCDILTTPKGAEND